ncbi:hypothetical protein CYMTET_12215 [Cymbomonas tetramitiformis]|uniref:EF-hand domain-containing protein n=1 Tax=Cymbomonas tetramitiformis TaxID=36881 RepID=A0AAE0LCN0_9CHLO|nr:hypothetical protein CYMTET_12215 [Cymbomonas tetramitiformis]
MKEFSVEEVARYRIKFGQFDYVGEGVIDKVDLETVLRALGQAPLRREIDTALQKVPTSLVNSLSFQEFLKILLLLQKDDTPEEMFRRAFSVLDRDGSGKLSEDDLRRVLTQIDNGLTMDELDELIGEVDVDGTGEINMEDLKKVLLGL